MNDSSSSKHWRVSTGLAFWGVTIQSVFNLISLGCILYVGYNMIDIALRGILPSILSASLDYYEDNLAAFLGTVVICFAISFLGYIFYLVGICLFKRPQRSVNSNARVRNIMIVELLMPVLLILFFVIYYKCMEIVLASAENAITYSILPFIGSLVAIIFLLIQFGSLSKEDSWSEKSRSGASDVKTSYVCLLWMLGVLILGLGIMALTVYSFINNLASTPYNGYGYQDMFEGVNALSRKVNDLISSVKIEAMFTIFVIFILGAWSTIKRIVGWRMIQNGGNEEAYNLSSNLQSNTGSNRFCHKCGAKLPEGSSFCPSCGVAVAVVSVVDSPTQKEYEPQVMEQESLPEYEEEEQDNKKKWMLWGGIAAGIVAIVAILLALWDSSDKMEPNAKVFSDRSVVFKSIESGVGIEPIAELAYAAEVDSRKSEYDKDGIWTEVVFEKDGKSTKGYMAKGDIINIEDFSVLQKGGMYDPDLKGGLPINIERLALLSALKSAGSDWHLEGVNLYGKRQSNSKRLTVRGVSPSEDCLGFILRNNATGERKFFLYSTPDIYSPGNVREPVFLYSETVKGGDIISDVNYYKKKGGRYEVIYVSNSEPDNSEDFVYEGSAEDENEYVEVVEEYPTLYMGPTELHGQIDGKYDVRMTFYESHDYTISGWYKYLKNDVAIDLSGKFTNIDDVSERLEQDLVINEYVDGKNTGSFIGRFNGKTFIGKWVNSDGTKEMPFKLER